MVIWPTRPRPEKRRRPAVGYTTIGDAIRFFSAAIVAKDLARARELHADRRAG